MLIQLGPERPLYRAVTTALRQAILDGRLSPGSRLPGTRALALELGVSRIVTIAAFEQLTAEGYITSVPGAGSRVALAATAARSAAMPAAQTRAPALSAYAQRAHALVPHAAPGSVATSQSGIIDFRYATFVPEERTQRAWAHAVGQAAARADFEYPDPGGLATLRNALCKHLRRHRGIEAKPEDVLIVTGSQQALDLTARAVCDEGTRIGIEDPHYPGARQAFLAAGAHMVPCAIDRDGLDVRRHGDRLAGVRAVYVTPSHQFPTGAVMNVERRLTLLAWAAQNAAWIVEDDYDSEFHYGTGTIPALAGLDTFGRVIYVGTFARTLSPELRLGYIVVPPALRDTFRAMKWLADRGSSPLGQRALATLMESGMYERAQRRMARSLAGRRARLLTALQTHIAWSGATWSGSGAYVFLRLPNAGTDAVPQLLAEAEKLGVRLYNASGNYLLPPEYAALLCGFAALTAEQIETGIERFASALFSLRSSFVSSAVARDG